MDYVGVRDYSYNQTLEQNNYLDVSFQMDIWSVDAGYTSGYYGGIISDPFFSVQYQTVEIITDIIDDIVNDIIFDDINTDDMTVDISIDDFFEEDISFEIDFAPIEDLDITVDVVSIDDLPEIEIDMETTETIEVEVVEEQTEEMIEEQIEETIEEPIEETVEESVDEPEQEEAEEVEAERPEPKEMKQKIAKKIIASQKDKMSVESQTTQLALMIVLSDSDFNSYTDKKLVDRQFYEDVNLYLDQNMIEDTNLDLFYMDYLGMNELVDLQWQR
jgi:hypothetical protein